MNAMNYMRLTAVHIRNYKGIKDGRYPLGKSVTVISGENETAKTTIVDALMDGLGGGDITWRKNKKGDKPPEIDIEVNDGEFIIQRRAKGIKGVDETTVLERVRDAQGRPTPAYEKMKRPQTFIDARYDARLSDPIAFDDATPAERFDILLQLAPDVAPERIQEAVGADLWPTAEPYVRAGGNSLTVLTAVRDAIFGQRTGINRDLRTSKESAEKLKRTIPADAVAPDPAALPALEAKRDELAGRITEARANAESAYRSTVATAKAARDSAAAQAEGDARTKAANLRRASEGRVAAITADAEARIAAIRQELSAAVAKETGELQVEIDAIAAAGEQLIDAADAVLDATRATAEKERSALLAQVEGDIPTLDKVKGEVAELRARADEFARTRITRDQIAEMEAEVVKLTGQADRFTAGLDAVDALKAEVIGALPIAGLSFEGKDILVDGVLYDEVNKANRLGFAAKIAAWRAERNPIRVIFLDNAESLDKKHRAALLFDLERLQMQAVVALVEEHAHEVKAYASAADAVA